VGLFHIKVKPDAQSIAAAAQTLGDAVNSPDAVKALLDGKLVSALRSVAATMTMEPEPRAISRTRRSPRR
jgi:flotillin